MCWREALQGYYNPIPPRPPNVNIYSYRGNGNPQSSGNFSSANSSNQYTNWDQGLRQAGTGQAELMVFVTDGDPTGYDFDKPGDPFDSGPPPDVAVNTNRGEANQLTMDRAVQEANTIKGGDTRMLAVGVGSALSNSGSGDRLIQISGPQVVRDADLADVEDLNDIDVALVTDFEDLAAFMRSIVLQLCSPSLTVRKLAQTAGDATYTPEEGRDITVTPTVPGGDGFTWILPDTTPATSKTVPTDNNGFAQFQWEPDTSGGGLCRDGVGGHRSGHDPRGVRIRTTTRATCATSSGTSARSATTSRTRRTRRSSSTRSGRRSSPAPCTTRSTTRPTSRWRRSTRRPRSEAT